MVSQRSSETECAVSNTVYASGSSNALAASSKLIPCFAKLPAALPSSHSNPFMGLYPSAGTKIHSKM